jgi:hypothetical protein
MMTATLLAGLAALSGCAAHNVAAGGMCKASGDCMGKMVCGNGGTCVRQQFSAGHKCYETADCAGTLQCAAGKCQ